MKVEFRRNVPGKGKVFRGRGRAGAKGGKGGRAPQGELRSVVSAGNFDCLRSSQSVLQVGGRRELGKGCTRFLRVSL